MIVNYRALIQLVFSKAQVDWMLIPQFLKNKRCRVFHFSIVYGFLLLFISIQYFIQYHHNRNISAINLFLCLLDRFTAQFVIYFLDCHRKSDMKFGLFPRFCAVIKLCCAVLPIIIDHICFVVGILSYDNNFKLFTSDKKKHLSKTFIVSS